jgi:glucose/arabinose dehydrogenase
VEAPSTAASASNLPSSSASDVAAADLVSIGAGLSGPAGLVASVFASGANHVSAFAFDGQGRLWFATAAYTDDGTDGIYLVPAAGAAPIEVVGDLHTPLGLLWLDGLLYVSAAHGVVAYGDFNGLAFGTTRTIVALPKGVGEVNGIALGPDGRMVVGISAPCDACQPASQDSAAILSFLPDGSDLQIYASGIRAAVGLAFFPGTSQLFVSMNQRDDLGEETPGDWLAVVSQGQDWGFPDCYGQASTDCAVLPAPVSTLDQHAAVSGVAFVTGQLGSAIGTVALVAEWAKGTVQRVGLAGDGAIDQATATSFLAGLTSPVPLATGPDGAVYVGDWGTGLIYRVAGA